MWYLIFEYECVVYCHTFKTKEEALDDYQNYNHVQLGECKISLAEGRIINKEVG